MSIVAGGMRKMMELLDKLSVPQIQQGMKAGRYPAYLAIPAIELKTRMQKQFEQQKLLQQPSPKETPTVAEQVMQEAQGMGSSMGAEIGAGVSGLPSNLPQEYAEGGIVAFGDGGEVERYQNTGLVESEEQRRAREAYEEANPFLRLRKKKKLTDEEAAALAAGETEQQRYYGRPDTSLTDAASAFGRGLRALIPGAGEAAIPSGMEAEMGGGYQAPPVDTSLPTSLTRPDIMTGRSAPPAAGPGAKSAANAGFGSLAAGPQFSSFGRQEQATRQELAALQEQEEARNLAYRQARDAKSALPGKALEGYENELREEARQAGATKEQAKYIALVEAGLIMLGGNSQNAFENISKGALVGLNSYKSALKDVEKAQKDRSRAFASIEQSRRAEAAGDRDRELRYLEKAHEAETESGRAMVNAIMKARGVDEATAIEIWKTQYGGAKTLEAARIAASGRGQGGLTEAQLASIRGKVIENLDPTTFRAEMAKKLIDPKAKVPPVGVNKKFDKDVQEAYEAEIQRRILQRLGKAPAMGGTTAPVDFKAAGYNIIPD